MVLEMKTTVLHIGNRNNICMAIAFSFWGLKLIRLNLIRLNWSEMPLKPCLKYTPPESTNQKLDANEMRLEFVVAFNDSDSTAGWFQFFLGTTLYLSSQGFIDCPDVFAYHLRSTVHRTGNILYPYLSTVEQTLDPMYSLNLSPMKTPSIGYRQGNGLILKPIRIFWSKNRWFKISWF